MNDRAATQGSHCGVSARISCEVRLLMQGA
jgi:hypothetical protein